MSLEKFHNCLMTETASALLIMFALTFKSINIAKIKQFYRFLECLATLLPIQSNPI